MSKNANSKKIHGQFRLSIPTQIYSGSGEVKRIGDIVKRFGKRILIVSMRDLRKVVRHVEKIVMPGAFVETVLLDNAEPTCRVIDALKKEFRGSRIEVIIGLGGGTAIDVAKALAVALTHPKPIWSYVNLSNRPPAQLTRPVLPIIAIPTTSGTGSEVTQYSVLINSETAQKGTIQEQVIFPRAAILDPDLTKTQPRQLTAATGIDAFVHALESFLNISKYSPVADWASREAMSIIFRALPKVYRDPGNLSLRAEMCWGSTLAGIAISHRGTTAVHALGEPLGAATHIPHAHSIAICALPVLRHSRGRALDKLAELCDILSPRKNVKAKRDRKSKKAIMLIAKLFRTVRMVRKVSDYIDLSDLNKNKLLKNVRELKKRPLAQHPVLFSKKELVSIIDSITE
ncbi:MAG: iron-containing alcohol dehydrogenase [Candidatus Omnitrophota bacterium]